MGCEVALKVFAGRDASEKSVAATAVVQGLDEVEDRAARRLFGRQRPDGVKEFGLKRGEGTFCQGMDVAVTGGNPTLQPPVSAAEVTG